jgi:transcriptional regulator with XRE-family HTH domain
MEEMTLDQLRASRQLTQKQISQALGITQAAVSKLEFRSDSYISSIRKYIEALGGQMEIRAVFSDDKAVKIRGLDGDDMLDIVRKMLNAPCRLTPLNPAQGQFKNWFCVHSVSENDRIVNFEKDNGDLVEVPIRRIREFLPAASQKLPTLVLDGQVRWYPEILRWRFVE